MQLAEIELDDGSHLKSATPSELTVHEGDTYVAQAGRVLEYGRIASLADVSAERDTEATLLRRATLQDRAKADENALRTKMAREVCEREIEKQKLDMTLIGVRYSFDRKLLTVLFTAEERVDFRELIRVLASELNTRVEMRQIGVRDAAGLVGGMGPCGRVLCCASWLRHFEAVNVRMAKNQSLSLNPASISGMCGRLKCCLRYENECYRECSRGLFREGTWVETPQGRGRVIDRDILRRRLRVRLDDERVLLFPADDVEPARDTGGGRSRSSRGGRKENV